MPTLSLFCSRVRLLAFGTLAFAVLLLAACSKTETAPADDAAAARDRQVQALVAERDQLSSRESALTPVKAEWNLGETESELTGYYDGETLRIIDEQMTMGTRGSASAKYFYSRAGKLFAYRESKQAMSGAGSDDAKTESVELQLWFTDAGSLLSGERKLNGEPAALLGIEDQGVRMHAGELEAVLGEVKSPAAK